MNTFCLSIDPGLINFGIGIFAVLDGEQQISIIKKGNYNLYYIHKRKLDVHKLNQILKKYVTRLNDELELSISLGKNCLVYIIIENQMANNFKVKSVFDICLGYLFHYKLITEKNNLNNDKFIILFEDIKDWIFNPKLFKTLIEINQKKNRTARINFVNRIFNNRQIFTDDHTADCLIMFLVKIGYFEDFVNNFYHL
ncbi:MAG: hypothetical protein ABIB46_01160 [bacterium]